MTKEFASASVGSKMDRLVPGRSCDCHVTIPCG